MPQRAVKRIVHREKRRSLLHGKIVNTHNMLMVQTSEQLRLSEERFDILVFERGVQDFERCPAFQIDMFA